MAPDDPHPRDILGAIDDRLNLIRLRAKRLVRREKTLQYTRDAYREAIADLTTSIDGYQLEELSPDQEPVAVLAEIRRLAQRRALLVVQAKEQAKTLGELVGGARSELDAAIFDDQLELFPALQTLREALGTVSEADPVKLQIDKMGHPKPLVERPKKPAPRRTRGRAKPSRPSA